MKTKLILLSTIFLFSCGRKEENSIKLPYDCLFNDLPNWCKEIIIVEAIVLNVILLAMIITYFVLKYKLKQMKNEKN
jgi:hypothetical protein